MIGQKIMQWRGTTRMYVFYIDCKRCIAKTSFAYAASSGVVSGNLMDGNKLFPSSLCKPATRKAFFIESN